ncbi:sigma-54 dependent transcriptional regulator PrdR [Peptostreptococcus anaerobius]|uniref:sigma-54 dependent transcriptional regulator PrdR n=1 Tax=Peptostreptococcus anaerobius TaxID=1261 RepID=UPI0002A19FE3|nr:sigma-54 dependent transcriptional regulator PrdR [Peptostreptococcus anaerobius]EKX93236.1 PAS domain S-box protein [Peptostreptococcus anaerobius VPI 4330 = DSM 2949]
MFKVPSKENLEDVMQKDFVTADENLKVEDVFEVLITNKKTVITVDRNKNMITGYIGILDIANLVQKKGTSYRQAVLKDIVKKEFIMIDRSYNFRTYTKFLEDENYMYIVVEDDSVVGYLNAYYVKQNNYPFLNEEFTTLKHIINQVNEGISAIDRDGVVILWNKFMQKRYNITSDEIVGRKMSDYLVDTISERVLTTRQAMSDVYYTKKNMAGTDLYGVVHAFPVFHKEEFVGVVCTEVDVTDASKLSKELELTQEKIKYLEEEVKSLSIGEFDKILGKSYPLEKAKNMAKQVAKTNSSIMINGESGTGKEVFARAIHKYSEREGTFIPVNCSAIPQELFESEFFGYEPGAFTGATKNGKPGIFELANKGTLFLDEIGDMPYNMQAKLLRVLQEREIMRVGGNEIIKIDVRVISASNKDLAAMVKEETFREDLYYRLNVVEINLPSLRERGGDVAILIYEFLEEQCKINNKPFLKISKEALDMLQRYEWKGNIRELKNTMENMVVLSNRDTLEVEDIPVYIRNKVESKEDKETMYPMDLNMAVQILEKNKIQEALEKTSGNRSKAAKILNIPRTTLYYKMDQYGIRDK